MYDILFNNKLDEKRKTLCRLLLQFCYLLRFTNKKI